MDKEKPHVQQECNDNETLERKDSKGWTAPRYGRSSRLSQAPEAKDRNCSGNEKSLMPAHHNKQLVSATRAGKPTKYGNCTERRMEGRTALIPQKVGYRVRCWQRQPRHSKSMKKSKSCTSRDPLLSSTYLGVRLGESQLEHKRLPAWQKRKGESNTEILNIILMKSTCWLLTFITSFSKVFFIWSESAHNI